MIDLFPPIPTAGSDDLQNITPAEYELLQFFAKQEGLQLSTLLEKISIQKPHAIRLSTSITIFIMIYVDCLTKKNASGAFTQAFKIVKTATTETENLITRLFSDDRITSAHLTNYLENTVIDNQDSYLSMLKRLIVENSSSSH